MTVQLDLPPDVVDLLTEEARRNGLSLSAYVVQSILRHKAASGVPAEQAETSRRRAEAAARILEIQRRVQPDPEGLTSRGYINFGRH